jgi:hypothetical protein
VSVSVIAPSICFSFEATWALKPRISSSDWENLMRSYSSDAGSGATSRVPSRAPCASPTACGRVGVG